MTGPIGISLNGMKKTRRTAISSICAIMISSQMKLNNVFSTSTFSRVIRGDLMMSMFWTEELIEGDDCGSSFKTRARGSLESSPVGS